MFSGAPIACLEVLGQSVLDRTIQKLHGDGITAVTVVAEESMSPLLRTPAARQADVTLVQQSGNLQFAAECMVREYVEQGVQAVFVLELGAYFEFDFADLARFYKSNKQSLTVLIDNQGSLRSWIIPADRVHAIPTIRLASLTEAREVPGTAHYPVSGYVNRLEDGRDLRRFILDAFLSRCAIKPTGREIKPGVWLDDGVEVHRRARIVAPAYLGRGTTLSAGAVITRGSNLERGCRVGRGTVVEDTSVFANTYLGGCLDVSHAVVNGNKFLHLPQNTIVEINDARLLGLTAPVEHAPALARVPTRTRLSERLLAAWSQTAF